MKGKIAFSLALILLSEFAAEGAQHYYPLGQYGLVWWDVIASITLAIMGVITLGSCLVKLYE